MKKTILNKSKMCGEEDGAEGEADGLRSKLEGRNEMISNECS